MITSTQYHLESGEVNEVAQSAVASTLHQQNLILWVDLQEPTDEELRWLEETFDLHPLVIDNIRTQQERAKFDRYGEYYFFVAQALRYDKDKQRLFTPEVDLVVAGDFLISVHSEPILGIEQTLHRLQEAHIPHEATPFLFYLIVDSLVDNYFPILDAMGERIDDLDAAVTEHPDREALRMIFRMRRGLLHIRRTVGPLRDALNELIREGESDRLFQQDNTRLYFSDVYDHVLRLTDYTDTYRDMLSGSIDAYQSSLSNTLNVNMQRLTVIATILATGAVITGFFGMNLHGAFINSPSPYGAWMLLGVLLLATLLELWYFHRKGWI